MHKKRDSFIVEVVTTPTKGDLLLYKLAEKGLLCQVTSWLETKSRLLFGDRYAKKLNWGSTVFLFLEALLSRRPGVQNIVDTLVRTPCYQEWTGVTSIHQSSLNRRLSQLPPEQLRDLYHSRLQQLLEREGPPLPKHLQKLGPLAAVDSSTITVGKLRGEWAFQQAGTNAVKLHTCVQLTGESSAIPTASVLSTGTVADLDSEVLKHLVLQKAFTYLLDRGYIHYAQFIAWERSGIKFVARLKNNSKAKVLRTRKVTKPFLKQDATVEITSPETGETGRFRLVEYTYVDKKGKSHPARVLTNRWDVTAAEVAELYRYRWKVELFFKFMKSSLHLKKLYSSCTPAAVWNQIYLNLIAYVLCEHLRLRHAPHQRIGRVLAVFRLYLTGEYTDFLNHLNWVKTRTSKGRRKKGGRPRIHPKRLTKERILFY
ncbi:IS4 family transposase [Paenibacillus sp. FSL H7-0756]|uniref:IS4 family transposase n=1 Tax=unclassified Paenibacillus TaxID=185978 RepID=UPI0030FAF1F5